MQVSFLSRILGRLPIIKPTCMPFSRGSGKTGEINGEPLFWLQYIAILMMEEDKGDFRELHCNCLR